MHDDQHGTAIISSAALLNALEIAEKDIAKIKSTYLIPLLPLNLSNHNKKLARI